ncbi:toll/interleukin-1 receptor domain-containing protein [Skermanella mucosa]|uniref:tetratricopeptide repeat protein n=1 Tax=Skermanella mucosa TaxID=1789672 RepID=UPI00192A84C9|nr:toll/interleukin-1 receptor domain-containing protein [Skermanella mucosa]UEM21100.1 toll/interleukin-1 receptor domain-containing protein [Skermanella mucosa]
MDAKYDIYLSFAYADRAAVLPVIEALKSRNLRVFHDETEITDGDSIVRRIVEGLGCARMLVAWYSAIYPTRRACQWELTAAIIAARQESPNGQMVERRILALNPEPGTGHLQPAEMLAKRLVNARGVRTGELARRVADRLSGLAGSFGEIRTLGGPHWHGGNPHAGSSRFVGRFPDMWRIDERLSKNQITLITGESVGLVQVQGMGGIGKTLLAEEYARRFCAAYPGGIFWLNAARGQDLGAQRQGFAGNLGIATAGLGPHELEGALKVKLAEMDSYLWIVDDLPPDAGPADLNAWRAPTDNGATLVTTRGTGLGGAGFVYRLGLLSDTEAHDLLTKRRLPVTNAEKAAAREILALLGNHALAVDVAGAAVEMLGYENFRDRLRDPTKDATELAAELAYDLPTGHARQVAATLLGSIERLDLAGLHFLHFATLLAPVPIPRSLVADVFARLSGDDDGLAEATRAVNSAMREALAELIPGNGDNAGDAVSVHVLASRTFRFHMGAPPPAMRGAVVAALTEAMEKAEDIRNHAALLPLVPHARALTGDLPDAPAAMLLSWLGRFNFERGAYANAEADYRRTFEASKRLLGDEHPDTLTSMNNLAETLRAQGDHGGAWALEKPVLALRRRVLGDEHPDTLTSMNNLAATLGAQGDHGGARALEEQVLTLRRRVLGDEHPDTLTSMNNLAATLGAQGDHGGARALLEQVLALRRRVLGDEHPDTLGSIGNLAGTLWAQGDHGGARALEEQVLALSHRVLGDEHPDTLSAMNDLSVSLMMQGDLTAARELAGTALDVRRRKLGPDHPDTFASQYHLARILLELNELELAQKNGEAAQAGLEERLGANHWRSWAAKGLVAACRAVAGNTDAVASLQASIDELGRLLYPDHPEIRWLAKWLHEGGEPAEEPESHVIDPLHLAFLLVLDGRLPAAELATLAKPGAVTAALDTLKPPVRHRGTWLNNIMEQLAAGLPQAQPDPLWRGWMESVNGAALERLRESLEAYASSGVSRRSRGRRTMRSDRA